MGADGGTIPKLCELVKKRTKKEIVSRDVQLAGRWRICQLSQQTLREPIVVCRLGMLYNKEAVLEALLTKGKMETMANGRHIRGVRDVKQLRLTANPEYHGEAADWGDAYKDRNVSPWICPVTGLEMNGNQRFVVNWECGCVLSEKAVREVETEGCHGCGRAVDRDSRVVINGSEEEKRGYAEKEQKRVLMIKNKKKEKDSSKVETMHAAPSTSSEQTTMTRKRKMDTVSSAKKTTAVDATNIQDDPSTSDAYKGLFTTCEAAKRQPAQHWVTHNPLFY